MEIKLTKTEERVLEVIRDNVSQKRKESVAIIAKKAQVAPSLVIKVAKKLGYSGINEMYYQMTSSYMDTISFDLEEDSFYQEGEVNVYLRPLCELLMNYKRKRIIVNSMGDAEFAENYLLRKLWERGFLAVPYHKDILLNESQVEPGMMIAINERGVVLLETSLRAKDENYNLISITGNAHSPLAMCSHLSIQVRGEKSFIEDYSSNFFVAHIITFIEILFSQYDELEKKIEITSRKQR